VSACGGTGGSANAAADPSCTGSISGGGSTVALVVDGRSPAVDSLIQTIGNSRNDPDVAWHALNSTGKGNNSTGAAGPGIVMVAIPDARGNAAYPVTFDLRGVGANDAIRKANARSQTQCLVSRLSALPVPPAPAPATTPPPAASTAATGSVTGAGPALVASLADVASQARQSAGNAPVTLAVYGLGRSSIVGRPWVSIGLKNDQRPQVFEKLAEAGLKLPDLAPDHVALHWIAPSDGAPDEIVASGLNSLAKDLCARMSPDDCEVTQ
jgi:hypothetical protein